MIPLTVPLSTEASQRIPSDTGRAYPVSQHAAVTVH